MGLLDFYKGRRVFLTGHTGFKGTWLANILISAGADVHGYALKPPTDPSIFELTATRDRMQSTIGDVRDREGLVLSISACAPEIIIHLAAQPLVRRSYREPAETYEVNVMGTVNVLEGIRRCPSVRSFVNVTTDKVYENKEWHWGYRENENLNGFDPYSNSKSCSELITSSYANSFFAASDAPAISTARSGNVIGGGDFAADRIVPDCIRAAQDGNEILVRNPHSTRPYQHVLECLSGYLLLAERQFFDKRFQGAYNFGPEDSSCVTTGELVDLFCRKWEGTSWCIQGDGGPHEASFLKLDCSKSRQVLGWRPRWSIETAIEKTVEFGRSADRTPTERLLSQINEYFTSL